MNGQINIADYKNSKDAPIKSQMEYLIDPLPCPFCGTEIKKYPKVMTIARVHSEEYLIAEMNNGYFHGTDNWFQVECPHCGSTGARGQDRLAALQNWNRRSNY